MNKMTRAIIEILDDVDCVITPDGEAWFSADGEDYINPDFRLSLPLAKLLQARMRQDGWEIKIYNAIGVCQALARRPGETNYKIQSNPLGENEEPAALHALFCKVYDIGVRNEK